MRYMKSTTLCLAGAVLVGVLLPGWPIGAQQPTEPDGIDWARFVQQAVSEIHAEAARRRTGPEQRSTLEREAYVPSSPPFGPSAGTGPGSETNATAGAAGAPEGAIPHEGLEMIAGPELAQSDDPVPQGEAQRLPTMPTTSGYESNTPEPSPSAPPEDWRTLHMNSASFTPAGGLDAALVSGLPALRADGRTTTYGFLLLTVLLNERIVGDLSRYGVTVLEPHDTFFKVRLPADEAALAQVLTLPEVEWIGYGPAALKLGQELAALPSGVQASSGQLPFFVSVFDDDPGADFRLALERTGAVVGNWDADLLVYNVAASRIQLDNILRLDFVHAVELMRPVSMAHDQSTAMISADYIRAYGHRGSSVSVGIMDSGLGWGHVDLMYFRACGIDYTNDNNVWVDGDGHGTHVLGTMIGNGHADRRYTGMAPGVQAVRLAKIFGSDGESAPPERERAGIDWLASPTTSCSTDMPSWSPRPHVINYSGGGGGGYSGYGTDQNSMKFDSVVWNSKQLVVVSAGNNGGNRTINSPATAKNVLAVGNVGDAYFYDSSRDESVQTGFIVNSSSRGPTLDGRVKPNLAAPGNSIMSPEAGTQRSYIELAGTSMAAPHVTGLAATLMDHYPAFKWRPAMARAYLMTATMPGAYGSRRKNFYGYGVVSSWLAHYANFSEHGWFGRWGWGSSAPTGRFIYWDVNVPSGASEMIVTLTWDEPPASNKSTRAVNYNLDLWADRLGGGVSCGSRGDCGEYGSASTIDNVERIRISRPVAGTYRIKAYSRSAYVVYDGRRALQLPVGMGAVVVRGSTTQQLSVTTTPSSVSVPAGASFNIRTTLNSTSWIAGGVTQIVNSGIFGVDRVQTTRRDGVTMDFTGTRSLTVGDIPYGSSRGLSWTLRAPTAPGLYRLQFVNRSLNGLNAYAGSLVRVTSASDPPTQLVEVGGQDEYADPGGLGRRGFTDDPIIPGVTVIKAVHWNELRSRIDAVRSMHGVPPFNWTAPVVRSGDPVRAVHFAELRTALNEAYDRVGFSRPSYTDADGGALVNGTVVKALHVEELRRAVVTLEQ